MAYSSKPIRLNINAILNSDIALSGSIRNLLSMKPYQVRSFIGGTSISAYRRIHEVLTGILDSFNEALRRQEQSSNNISISEIDKGILDLSRGLILVEYQEARGQISRPLADEIKDILNNLIQTIGNIRANPNTNTIRSLRKSIERARTFFDALVVLVYKYGRK